jgi:hypothetical protein
MNHIFKIIAQFCLTTAKLLKACLSVPPPPHKHHNVLKIGEQFEKFPLKNK